MYDKNDFWAQKARKEGYPARSVYKLIEIDAKFRLFPKVPAGAPFKVLDLGAAPGSWSLYALRRLGAGGSLCACDLGPLSGSAEGLFDDARFFFLQGDFTTPESRAIIAGRAPFQLVLSDAAPLTSGNRSVDVLRSLDLAENALSIAEQCLESGARLVIKIFQGCGSAEFLKKARLLFDELKTFKPTSCRANSFETYIIGLGKR
ncbi:MAG: RlmE family RNA methyltransferase [Spirochaetaceae bacterium]|jgi:23S rRNA (uridine2552-2'-O)-methyltransferase|nr:RlmE family RNA methyltransferase [Spirochaetaceae bacterium]